MYCNGYYREIIFFTIFAVYAVLEQSPMNPILNPFILFTANLVYKNYTVMEQLEALDVETLTPIEALNFLYELKKTLKGSLNS